MTTIETGAGISTILFAAADATHAAVVPWQEEIDRIRAYGTTIGVDMKDVTMIAAWSEEYLPTLNIELDLVFIDGMHAFPWPTLDWYYAADWLRVGGFMIIDDTQLPPAGILSEFLKSDKPRWRFVKSIGRTDILQKTKQQIHDVVWHEQPWTAGSVPAAPERAAVGPLPAKARAV